VLVLFSQTRQARLLEGMDFLDRSERAPWPDIEVTLELRRSGSDKVGGAGDEWE
jgi:hypothetical protein